MAIDEFMYFSLDQGNLLIRLLIAHVISDFVLQTTVMVENKKWFSKPMFWHIVIVYITAVSLTGLWLGGAIISFVHYIIDGLKIEARNRKIFNELLRFNIDQALHITLIVMFWTIYEGILQNLIYAVTSLFLNFNSSLTLLGYLVVIGPVSYIIKFATQGIVKVKKAEDISTELNNSESVENGDSISDISAKLAPEVVNEHGGRMIGVFERIIILTFVFLLQYEAIGFLITGKSIIRFSQTNENSKSEYVLVGTMMSYAFAILTGVLINWIKALV